MTAVGAAAAETGNPLGSAAQERLPAALAAIGPSVATVHSGVVAAQAKAGEARRLAEAALDDERLRAMAALLDAIERALAQTGQRAEQALRAYSAETE